MPPESTDTSRAKVAEIDQAQWSRLAQAETAGEFCESWLVIQSRFIDDVSSGLVVLGDDSGGWMPVAAWPRGTRSAQDLGRTAERTLKERRGIVSRVEASEADDDGDALHLGYPVQVAGSLRGVAVLCLAARPEPELKQAMRQLQWGVAWLQNWALRGDGSDGGPIPQRLSSALELIAIGLQEERFQPAATALVTELATRLQCDRVSVGFVEGRQTKVKALSHSAQFGKQMNLIRAIGSAMGESVDQQETLVYPEEGNATANVLKAHEQLSRTHGAGSILTVPFVDAQGHAFGAMTLERSAEQPFDRETVDLCDGVGAVVGPVLDEKRRNSHLLPRKIWDSLWGQFKKLVGPRYAVRKLVAGLTVAAILFFTFAKGTYRVTAETILEGEIQRVVAAPFRGFIREAPVRSGDIVEEGSLMATLDDRDLRVEYSRVSSEREQYLLEHRRAMSEGDVATMNVLTKRMQQAEAQIALLEEQIARTRMLAPFDGLVVSGDLSQALGAPVDEGQVLFEVAPLDAYRVMLKVPEEDVNQVQVGQKGDLVLTAMPETKLPFVIKKTTPVSFAEEGKNLFMVEAELGDVSARLRPGMEGFGKVVIDERRLIWIWTHKAVDWLRIWVWSWMP